MTVCQVIDLLYANSGWHFNEVEKAILGGVGKIISKLKQKGAREVAEQAKWYQQEYNWIGYVAVSKPDKRDLRNPSPI